MIVESMRGILFLGTPHRGSPFAPVDALLSLFSSWRGSRAELLDPKANILRLVFDWLQDERNGRWFMI
jgi:hypothetical protein